MFIVSRNRGRESESEDGKETEDTERACMRVFTVSMGNMNVCSIIPAAPPAVMESQGGVGSERDMKNAAKEKRNNVLRLLHRMVQISIIVVVIFIRIM